MSEILELNREEITRLSRMDDIDGHAWALYLLLKKHMDVYTGVVQVEKKVLVNVSKKQLHLRGSDDANYSHIDALINALVKVEVISNFLLIKDMLSVTLPIAFSETCLESSYSHH